MQKRKTKITTNYLTHPAGSVLIETGNTKVICSVIATNKIPRFLKDSEPEQGWLTASYNMIPGSTNFRKEREIRRGKISGRTAEIQRLIGRSLRTIIDLTKIPGITLNIDCDVIEADGGTRTAAITGSMVALALAVKSLLKEKQIREDPIKNFIAAISVGIVNDEIVCDLDYKNDSQADTDMNVVMTENGSFIEIQGTAEQKPLSRSELDSLLDIAEKEIKKLIKEQKNSLQQK